MSCSIDKCRFVGANAGVYFILDLSPVAKNLGLAVEDGTIKMMERMVACKLHLVSYVASFRAQGRIQRLWTSTPCRTDSGLSSLTSQMS
jgi:hypothetical protein